MGDGVLSGVRVLDLSQYAAGPYCTKLLAEMGAQVIKVERPGRGDATRDVGPFYKDAPNREGSGLFLYLNTGKKGITLDVKSATGKKIVRALVEKADVVVESFSAGTMEKLGLDYTALSKINPGLIMTSVSDFGDSGPYRDYKSADIVSFAMGGLMSLVGDPDRPPVKLPGPMTHYWAGVHAFTGTMVALLYRDVSGEGQHVAVSILETVASQTNSAYQHYEYLGETLSRTGNTSRFAGGVSQFQPTKDGGYVLIALTPWENLVALLGKPELAADPRFATREERQKHGADLDKYVAEYTLQHSKEESFQAAQEQRLTWAPINTVEDLFSSPQLKSQEYFKEIDHPSTGPLRYPGVPMKLGETPFVHERAPLLGEHNQEVYAEMLGYAKEDVIRLRQLGVI